MHTFSLAASTIRGVEFCFQVVYDSDIEFGVRFQQNTGQAVEVFQVVYDTGFQLYAHSQSGREHYPRIVLLLFFQMVYDTDIELVYIFSQTESTGTVEVFQVVYDTDFKLYAYFQSYTRYCPRILIFFRWCLTLTLNLSTFSACNRAHQPSSGGFPGCAWHWDWTFVYTFSLAESAIQGLDFFADGVWHWQWTWVHFQPVAEHRPSSGVFPVCDTVF